MSSLRNEERVRPEAEPASVTRAGSLRGYGVRTLDPPLTKWETLGKLLNLFVPQFFQLQSRIIVPAT